MFGVHNPKLSDRLRLLQWVLPVAIMALAALYQLGPARYIHDNFGIWSHYELEVFFYGTTPSLCRSSRTNYARLSPTCAAHWN